MPQETDIRRPQPVFLNLSPTLEGMEDLSKYALYVHTSKHLSTSAGTWEVTLTPTADDESKNVINRSDAQEKICQSIRPQDIVIIGEWGRGFSDADLFSEQHFMIGFVDGVYKSSSRHNDSVRRSVIVRGRDFTKAFLKDDIVAAPEFTTDEEVKQAFKGNEPILDFLGYTRGIVGKNNIFLNSYLTQAVYWILQNTPSMRMQLDYFQDKAQADKMLRPIDIFRTYLLARADEKMLDTLMTNYAGSILNYFSSIIDPAFYELWIDTVPHNAPGNDSGKTCPVLIMRPKPYDYNFEKVNSRGESIKNVFVELDHNAPTTGAKFWESSENAQYNFQGVTHPITQSDLTIDDEDILDDNMGISDDEVFTVYRVGGAKDMIGTSPLAALGINYPLVDADMIHGYGLREMTMDSKLIPGSQDEINQLYATKTGEKLSREDRSVAAKTWGAPLLEEIPNKVNLDEAIDAVKNNKQDSLQDISMTRLLSTEKRDRLWRWNRYNHLLESGNITIKGRNAFVGQKVNIPSRLTRGLFDAKTKERYASVGMQFYCVGVEQFGGWGQTWRTVLTLTRGANMAELEYYYNKRKFGQATGKESGVFSRNTEGVK